jgi:zinc protease
MGDLSATELVTEAEQRFTWPAQVGVPALEAPPSFLPSPRRTEEPRRYAPRATLQREPVKEGQLQLAWPAPSLRHDDVAALDAAALVLSHGDASRLHKVLKRDTLLVTGVSASCYTPRDPGVTVVGMTLPAANVPAAIRAATREVHRLRTEEITDEELELACRLLESDAVYQRETVQGQARKLGFYQSGTGGLEFEERYLMRLAALTPALVREAAERWLDPRALVAAAVLPPAADGESLDQAGLQALLEEACAAALRESAPPLKPQLSRPPPVRHAVRVGSGKAGEVVRTELPGGGVLLVREERHVPLVSLRAVWEGGLRAESEETGGAHLLLSRLVSKGTLTRTAEQIARESEAMCGSVGGLAGRNSFGVRAEALSRHFDAAFDLFAAAVAEPAFAPAEVEREKKLQEDELRTREDSPSSLAFQLFAQELYRQHPYRLDMLGTEESLAKLGPEQLSALRRARYGPAGAVLAVVGDIDAKEVERKVRARLSSAGPATGPATRARLSPPAEPPVTAPRLAVRALDKAQAHLVLGFPGTTLASPDKPALDVLASVLSGQGGRLFVELRDKKSLAYSVTGFSMEGVDPGSFALYIGCSPAKLGEALASLRAEIDKLLQAAPSKVELDRARTRLAGGHDIGLQRNSARASLLAFDECYHLGLGHSLRYPERIAAVTADDVLAVARKILRPEAEVIALVAPAASIPAELAERLPSAPAF